MITVIIFASSKKEAIEVANQRPENLKFVRVHSRVGGGNTFYTFKEVAPEPVEEDVIAAHPDEWKQFISFNPEWED